MSFKYLCSKQQFLRSNSESAIRSSSGKFITVYPSSDEQLTEIVQDLYPLLEGKDSPYILSDLRYPNSPIYFRYGGFINVSKRNEFGEETLLIPGDDGILIEDKRLPHYVDPGNHIRKPQCVQKAYDEYRRTESTPLDEFTLTPLHFSNAGGVYKAVDRQGAITLIKEARPYAGIDGKMRDAISRLDIEWKLLNICSNTGVSPKPLKKFQAWEHHYLQMEYLQGVTLNHWLANNYPYQWQIGRPEELNTYKNRILDIGTQIISAIDKVHQTGYVHGDIHLGNFMIDPDSTSVRLIDFEDGRPLSSREAPPHNALGFQVPEGCTAEEADWFAVSRTLASLCSIHFSLAMLSPQHWARTLNEIRQTFGEEYLRLILGVQERFASDNGIARVFFTPKERVRPMSINPESDRFIVPTQENLDTLRDDILTGISATRHCVQGSLFPGDAVHTDTLARASVDTGAAGVLLAMARSRARILSSDISWLKDIVYMNSNDSHLNLGLYTGISGIGLATYELNDHDFAAQELSAVRRHWTESQLSNLEAGLAGQGLALISYGELIHDKEYIDSAISIGEVLKWRIIDEKVPSAIQALERTPGFLRGWSGISLFWLALSASDSSNRDRYLEYAIHCLNKDLDHTVVDRNSGSRGILDQYQRSLPYFSNGVAGILTAICIARQITGDDQLFSQEWESLVRACGASQYAFCGVNNGCAGMIIANQFASQWSPQLLQERDKIFSQLGSYALVWNNTLQFPGDSLLRLSTDYSTGSAGILTALNTMSHSPWDFLPVPNAEKLLSV